MPTRPGLALLVISLACFARTAAAQQKREPITVEINSSKHLRLGGTIARVSVGSSDVADVAAFPPDQLLITGKRIGQTTATVWSRTDEVNVYIIRVIYPVDQMSDALKSALPEGKDLRVTSAGTSLVVHGEVTSPADVERAEEIVRGFAAAGAAIGGELPQIVNMMTVPGDYQVQLEVSFAEVSRSALKEIGVNFWTKGKDADFVGGLVSPTTTLPGLAPDLGTNGAPLNNGEAGLPVIQTPLTGTFGAIFATAAGTQFPFSAALSILAEKGYARTLSEPTLVAMSGQQASFLAGGEFPIPIPQALGQIGVEFKKFGIQLQFTPTVIGDTIQLKLAAIVSDIDFSIGLRLASVTVPGLTERYSDTTVRLKDGQSFAIAGLLNDHVRSSVDKFPGLGDLPILGLLFRSTSYRREETELLVVVTAHIARPQGERPPLPGEDTTADPSDLELFLVGSIESKESGEPRSVPQAPRRRKPVGPVGFLR